MSNKIKTKRVLMFDLDFYYHNAKENIIILKQLQNEGWEIHPSIDEINEINYKPLDTVGCCVIRTWCL